MQAQGWYRDPYLAAGGVVCAATDAALRSRRCCRGRLPHDPQHRPGRGDTRAAAGVRGKAPAAGGHLRVVGPEAPVLWLRTPPCRRWPELSWPSSSFDLAGCSGRFTGWTPGFSFCVGCGRLRPL